MLWGHASGGVRRYIQAKQDWFRDSTSWRHTIVAPGAQGEGALSIGGCPIPFSGGYRAPLNRRRGARTLETQRPDLIEAADPYRLAWSSLDAARRLNIPVVGFCHSNVEAMARRWGGPLGSWAARRYARRLYSQFDLVLAPSQSMCAQVGDWGIPRVVHQPLGVDTELFHPRRRDNQWRKQCGLDARSRVLIYAGRFGAEKNLQVLADAVRKLGPPYVLVALGAGPCPPKGEQVRLLPFTNDSHQLARALASSDVFIHAGDQETFGLAALEAMACGRPVIARQRGGLGELVKEEVGMTVEQGTPSAFADAIEVLFSTPLAHRSHAARALALTHRWPMAMARLFAQYQTLLEHP